MALLLMSMLTAGRAHAHLDPPADPPLLTEQDINTLTLLVLPDVIAKLLIEAIERQGGHVSMLTCTAFAAKKR